MAPNSWRRQAEGRLSPPGYGRHDESRTYSREDCRRRSVLPGSRIRATGPSRPPWCGEGNSTRRWDEQSRPTVVLCTARPRTPPASPE
jgi:hypothetical protein